MCKFVLLQMLALPALAACSSGHAAAPAADAVDATRDAPKAACPNTMELGRVAGRAVLLVPEKCLYREGLLADH